jgi:hypothetical protein
VILRLESGGSVRRREERTRAASREGLKLIRFRLLSAALTLLSGGLMVLAGYVGGTESWVAAGFIAILGGLVILAARAAARKADSGR